MFLYHWKKKYSPMFLCTHGLIIHAVITLTESIDCCVFVPCTLHLLSAALCHPSVHMVHHKIGRVYLYWACVECIVNIFSVYFTPPLTPNAVFLDVSLISVTALCFIFVIVYYHCLLYVTYVYHWPLWEEILGNTLILLFTTAALLEYDKVWLIWSQVVLLCYFDHN